MSKKIRQLTKKGDPMIRIQLPSTTVNLLKAEAKKQKRRVQDQFIKILAETFNNELEFDIFLQKFLSDLKERYQQ